MTKIQKYDFTIVCPLCFIPYKLEGPLEIYDINGKKRGFFEVQILIPVKSYPYSFPILSEISNKIPKVLDRHINKDGSCCVAILQEQIIEAQKGISVIEFIKKYAIPFFANQIYFEENKKWVNGDYLHGKPGQIQFYFEIFDSSNPGVILNGMELALNNKKIGRNDPCYCGSSKKYKKCHEGSLSNIRMLGSDKLAEDIEMLGDFFKKSKNAQPN